MSPIVLLAGNCWLADCWNGTLHFIPNCCFLDLGVPFWVGWVTILVIQGCTGTPNRHLEVQASIFIDFRVHFWACWDLFWRQVWVFSMIWGAKLASSFQVHLFEDMGVVRMPESNGWMCWNQSKNCCFLMIWLFPLIHTIGVPRGGFRCHFESFGGLGGNLYGFMLLWIASYGFIWF